MRKIIFLLFTVAVLLSMKETVPRKYVKPDWQKYKLRGAVKSVRETTYDLKCDTCALMQKGEASKHWEGLNAYYEFNLFGVLLLEEKFDHQKQITERKKIVLNAARVPYVRIHSVFSEGKVTRQDSLFLTYSELGNLMLVQQKMPNGKMKDLEVYRYDDKGRLMFRKDVFLECNYGRYDSLVTEMCLSSGKPYSTAEYHANGTLKFRMEYSPVGAIITKRYTNGVGSIDSTFAPDGRLSGLRMTRFNSKGDLEFESFNGGTVESFFKQEYRYTYDKNGNWTSMLVLFNKRGKYLVERKIKYY